MKCLLLVDYWLICVAPKLMVDYWLICVAPKLLVDYRLVCVAPCSFHILGFLIVVEFHSNGTNQTLRSTRNGEWHEVHIILLFTSITSQPSPLHTTIHTHIQTICK